MYNIITVSNLCVSSSTMIYMYDIVISVLYNTFDK